MALSDSLRQLEHQLDTSDRMLLLVLADFWDSEVGDWQLGAAYRFLAGKDEREMLAPLRFGALWHWRIPGEKVLPLQHQLPEEVWQAMQALPPRIGRRWNEADSKAAAYRLAANAIVEAFRRGGGPLKDGIPWEQA